MSKRIPVYLSEEELKLVYDGLREIQHSPFYSSEFNEITKLKDRIENEIETFEE